MIISYSQVTVLIIAVILIAACAPASTSAQPLQTSVTSTPTALPVTPASTLPTMAQADEPATEISPERSDSMKIKITLKNTELTATLIDSQATRDFISLLPLTLTLEDYGSTEKISYLPGKLSVENAPEGIDPSIGDITYYAPWGNLAIFIEDFGYSNGLILLGKIDGDMQALNVSGPLNVTIEAIK